MSRTRQIDPTVKYFPPRLMARLEYMKTYPLTTIEAPSGFGKTTLLEHFLETRLPASVPVYRYDFELEESLSIWKQICDRLGKIDPACRDRLLLMGPPSAENLAQMGQTLRELRCPEETYLWLDNYKRWDNPHSGDFLDLISEQGGENLHVIVSSQPLPPEKRMKTSRPGTSWRLRDKDLTFRFQEVQAYFLEAGVALSHDQCREVYHLTEGWVMALCLQLMCWINRGEFETGGMVALMEHTFWDQLTEEERKFLLRLSIFPKFSLAQASALSGLSMEDTDRLLREKRYFIRFSPESRCFSPHTQLRQLLAEHFALLTEDIKRTIYLQGGELAERAGDSLNAIRFYYAAGEWEQVLALPMTSHDLADLMIQDLRPIIVDILDRAPREVMLRHPRSVIAMAFALFIMGDIRKLAGSTDNIRSIIEDSALDEREKNALLGELELLLSFLEYNRIPDMCRRHKKALELLHGPSKLISPKSIWTFGSPSVLYLYWRESGKLDQELEEMNEGMSGYYELTHGHGYGANLIFHAEIHLMRGEIDDALTVTYQALYAASSRHQDSIYQCGLFLLCRLALQQHNEEELSSALQNLREICARHREDLSSYTLDLIEGYLALLLERPTEVAGWLAAGDITDQRMVMMVQPAAFIVYGKYLLQAGEYHKLLGVSQYFMGLSTFFPNLLPQVYAYIYSARANRGLNRPEEAVAQLQKALDIALPDRVYLPFAENYEDIQYILPQTMAKPRELEAIRAMAARFRLLRDTERDFTERERSIHYLVRERLTNKEIGLRLHLSPNTVRNTLSVMMRKKGVSTRGELADLPEEDAQKKN